MGILAGHIHLATNIGEIAPLDAWAIDDKRLLAMHVSGDVNEDGKSDSDEIRTPIRLMLP